jgi:hypothetical protein
MVALGGPAMVVVLPSLAGFSAWIFHSLFVLVDLKQQVSPRINDDKLMGFYQ